MTRLSHTAEIELGAAPEQVWRAITDPSLTRRYLFGCSIEGDLTPGGAWTYRAAWGDPVLEGTVVESDAPRRLRLKARDVWLPATRDDPPFDISWEIEPLAGGRSRVRLTHDGFPGENASYRHMADVGPILRGLRNVVDPDVLAAQARRDAVGAVEVRPLTPERLDDFLAFFDGPAFADNPNWSFCYCYNFRFAGSDEELGLRSTADNRRDMSEAIASGRAHGVLAYADGGVVGWCSASPRSEFPRLERAEWLPPGGAGIGIVGCLLVASSHRRHGVARALIAAALDYLAAMGCSVAEAYPLPDLAEDSVGHWGPIEVYRELGFETYRELPKRLVVRRPLTPV